MLSYVILYNSFHRQFLIFVWGGPKYKVLKIIWDVDVKLCNYKKIIHYLVSYVYW